MSIQFLRDNGLRLKLSFIMHLKDCKNNEFWNENHQKTIPQWMIMGIHNGEVKAVLMEDNAEFEKVETISY
jgi:hypothetical protein